MKKQITILILLFSVLVGKAQETTFEEPSTIYRNEFAAGGVLHTAGWGVNARYAAFLTGFKKIAFELEIVGLRHPKEVKIPSPYENNVKGYFYGKQNVITVIRPSIGIHTIFIPKQSVKGVSIGHIFHIGPSLAVAKPVYLNVLIETNDIRRYDRVIRKYDPQEHTIDNIYGRASYFEGIGEMKLYPGIFSKYALQFEYASQREVVRTIEAGLAVDLYFKEIPIMAFAENRYFYANLFVNIMFGKRNEY